VGRCNNGACDQSIVQSKNQSFVLKVVVNVSAVVVVGGG
jgi:hypothetical protein